MIHPQCQQLLLKSGPWLAGNVVSCAEFYIKQQKTAFMLDTALLWCAADMTSRLDDE
jgi:hypothetical protein